jgi:OCT family organic cation transporter-like MFS transporter 4/5
VFQSIGETLGNCLLPLFFWLVRDWIWFILLTTLPVALFTIIPKYVFVLILNIISNRIQRYMIESPRWLATKGRFKECAAELQKIADINKKDVQVTEKLLKEMMPNQVVETVYGVASLFCHWRLAKNTLLLTVSW